MTIKYLSFILILFWVYPIFSQVSYYQDVQPIIERHCINCHASGDIGPIPLNTYEDVASYASMIVYVIRENIMPPYLASSRDYNLINKREITDQEIETIENWIEGGLQEGKARRKSEKPVPEQVQWDTIICMEETFKHYGVYSSQFQSFILPLQFEQDRFIKNIEIIPGEKKILRAAKLSLIDPGAADSADEWDPRYGFYSYNNLNYPSDFPYWYTWTPHNRDGTEPARYSYFLPKNKDLVLNLFYGPYSQELLDSTCIGMTFEAPTNDIFEVQHVAYFNVDLLENDFKIPAGNMTRISQSFILPNDVSIASIYPLAHLLCSRWEVIAVLPDGRSRQLMLIDNWDFHWQQSFKYEPYIELPKGTKLVATAHYNNLEANPYNPAFPPITMGVGEHMYDESFMGFLGIITHTNLQKAYLKKNHSRMLDEQLSIDFIINTAGEYTVTLVDFNDSKPIELASNYYPNGSHSIRPARILESGRYAVQLIRDQEILDTWYFVKH